MPAAVADHSPHGLGRKLARKADAGLRAAREVRGAHRAHRLAGGRLGESPVAVGEIHLREAVAGRRQPPALEEPRLTRLPWSHALIVIVYVPSRLYRAHTLAVPAGTSPNSCTAPSGPVTVAV